jgi:hypothetical protein
MCVSAPYAIPVVVHATRQVNPRSILDVGAGFGKYGVLFREYLDIWNADDLARTSRQAWGTRLEGIEICADYLTPLHEFIYDKIHVGNALDVIAGLGRFDLIFGGDVLEHFEKGDGRRLVRMLYDHAEKCVLLTYPKNAASREGVWGNECEAHLSVWTREDFEEYERVGYTTVEGRADVVAIARPPHRTPFLVGCLAARRLEGWKGKAASMLVRTLGPDIASSVAGRIAGRNIALRCE